MLEKIIIKGIFSSMAKLELREENDPFTVTPLKMRNSSQVLCAWSFGRLGFWGCGNFSLSQSMNEMSIKHCTKSAETTKMATTESLSSSRLKFSREARLQTE